MVRWQLNTHSAHQTKMDQTTITSHWEVSIQEFLVDGSARYRVKRIMKNHYYAESETFTDKDRAVRQFNRWLG